MDVMKWPQEAAEKLKELEARIEALEEWSRDIDRIFRIVEVEVDDGT